MDDSSHLNWNNNIPVNSKAASDDGGMEFPMITPVWETQSPDLQVRREAAQTTEYMDDCDSKDDRPEPVRAYVENDKKEKLDSVNFSEEIKVDFIDSIDYRIMCRFLGVTSVNEVKNHPYTAPPLITLILMETLTSFMKKNGFSFAGELNFDQRGKPIPPEKNAWMVKNRENSFTTNGFMYFAHKSENKKNNIVFYLYTDLSRSGTSITCFSTDAIKSKDIINRLKSYSKKHNCLRGSKLKDINVISATFSEVELEKKFNWDNYYYPKSIKELFELEVFGFIKDVKKYNKCNITKRGLLLYGKPGCVIKGTKIKIRKKKKEGRHRIIDK